MNDNKKDLFSIDIQRDQYDKNKAIITVKEYSSRKLLIVKYKDTFGDVLEKIQDLGLLL